MGKYVLIEFDDDATAETLCARINDAAQKGKAYRLIGIFQKPPKKRCECGRDGTGRTSFVRRHRKTGFMYCTKCKRVRPGWQSPRNFLDAEGLPIDYFSRGFAKEAQIHMNSKGDGLIKNYPITDRLEGRTFTKE